MQEPETRLLTRIANVVDRAVLRGMALAFEAALLRPAEARDHLRLGARPYVSPTLERDPGQFFAFLDDDQRRLAEPSVESRRAFAGGIVVTRRFASEYVPYHPVASWNDARCVENDAIWVEHWMHVGAQRRRGTVVALHGFTMGSPVIDARVLMASRWFELGLDVALVTLPFHGRRASSRCRYSGELFASWNVGRLNEAVRQAVHDVHLVGRWLQESTGAPIGVLGVSLGGYVTALLAALRSDLAFAVPVVPAVALSDLPLRLFARSPRRGDVEPPFTRSELRRAYRVHSPLTYPLRTPRARVLIVGGCGDAVTPVSQARRLWRHWGRPKAVWFSGGHVVSFRRERVVEAIEEHLGDLGMIGAPAAVGSGPRAA
jgi:pimeloyl-ACP methyl ester carboxylesterase